MSTCVFVCVCEKERVTLCVYSVCVLCVVQERYFFLQKFFLQEIYRGTK
jgi:hypothetical protein